MGLSVYTVGQAAKRIGISAKAIRLYERRGLLPTVRRTESGYRLFDETDLGILRFIRRARSIGLGLDEIKDVLSLQRSGQQTCGRVSALLDAHIAEIDRALVDLYALRATLTLTRAAANNSDGKEDAVICHIIEADVPESPAPSVNGHTAEGRPVPRDDPHSRDECRASCYEAVAMAETSARHS
ncbi:MAG TPA: heavy metal-responsive transcriptional regulator [Micromonosporaceae bacterium]|nr:heavy metal-responsive transcriptional regulator [Micromonosporaceae bacterium]